MLVQSANSAPPSTHHLAFNIIECIFDVIIYRLVSLLSHSHIFNRIECCLFAIFVVDRNAFFCLLLVANFPALFLFDGRIEAKKLGLGVSLLLLLLHP